MEAAVGAGGVAEDVSDGHEEREERVRRPRFQVVAAGKVGEEGAAWTLQHVVRHVEDPEPDDEDGDGARAGLFGQVVAEHVAHVGGVADEEDGDGYGEGAGGDEGTAAAEARGAAVAVVAYYRLDDHPAYWAAEPDEGGPSVRDAQQLDVGGQQGEL